MARWDLTSELLGVPAIRPEYIYILGGLCPGMGALATGWYMNNFSHFHEYNLKSLNTKESFRDHLFSVYEDIRAPMQKRFPSARGHYRIRASIYAAHDVK